MKRPTITKLATERGEINGHPACAEALEGKEANHLLPEAPLDRATQDLLLPEVQVGFTEDHNQDLLSLSLKVRR